MAQFSLLDFPEHVLWAKYLVAYEKWQQDPCALAEANLGVKLRGQQILVQFLGAVVDAAGNGKEENRRILRLWEVFLMGGTRN